ncbi:MAG: SPW repeat protein [Myxococcales bacterium]
MPARVANIVVGVWLFVSAFLWKHAPQQMTNTWILGLLCVAFALIAMAVPEARYLNTALSIWLFVSAFVLPRVSTGTVWNNVICAIAIFLLSLTPTEAVPAVRRPVRQSGM